MSQAKISKIETGRVLPSIDDVERIARAHDAAPTEMVRLRTLSETQRDQVQDTRMGFGDLAAGQHDLAQLESGTGELRIFQPVLITGLLQTSEYARAIFRTLQLEREDLTDQASTRVADAVSGRMRRQEILDDPGKRFHFLMPEALLRNRVVPALEMTAQLTRLAAVATQENTTLSIIAEETRWSHPPLHGFSLLDDKRVVIDLYNTTVIAEATADVALYRRVFDDLQAQATQDVEPILDKYRRIYLKLAQDE